MQMEVQHTRTLNQNFQGYVLGNYIFLKLHSVILIQAKSNASQSVVHRITAYIRTIYEQSSMR